LTVKILFVKLGAIGDIVHALPALAAIRRTLPEAKVDWVAEARSAEILRENPMIGKLIEVDTHSVRSSWSPERILSEIKRQASDLRGGGYDIAIDLQGLLKSAAIAKISGAKRRTGFDKASLREPAARLMYSDKIAVAQGINVIDKNLQLVSKALDIDVDNDPYEFPIATSTPHRLEAEAIASKSARPFALINPGGGWVTKLWRAADFGRLARRIREHSGLEPIIITGPGESRLAAEASENAGGIELIHAEPSLKGFYELARRAAVYVGGDTGPTHIAVAAGTPVVGVFGPTEWWRNGSPRADDICVGRDDIGCRVDCHRRTCSKWICMDISVDTVFDAVTRRIELASTARREAAV
jgi:heptosyltransferase-1